MKRELGIEERAALDDVGRLLHEQRWASLATAVDGQPLATMVSYCLHPEFDGVLMHLSDLARHTQNIRANAYASLAISEKDDERRDPQTLVRVSIVGRAARLESTDAGYDAAKRCYLRRFPTASDRFDFADFALYHLAPQRVHCVLGFGRTLALSGRQLQILVAGAGQGP